MKRGQIYLVLLLMVLSTSLVVTPHTYAAVEEEIIEDANGNFHHIITIDIPAGTWTFKVPEVIPEDAPFSYDEMMLGGFIYEYTVPRDGTRTSIGVYGEHDRAIKWTPDGIWTASEAPSITKGSKVQIRLFPDYHDITYYTVTENGVTYDCQDKHYSAQKVQIWVNIMASESTPPPEKEVTLLVNLNKDKLTTGEEIVVSGSVKHNGASIPSSTVQVELLQNGVGVVVAPNVPVNQDGSFRYQWKLESTALTPPTGPEEWTARVTSKTSSDYMDKTVDKNFQVLQFWVVFKDMGVAQSGESVFNGEYLIAADVPAGIRVRVDWIGREQGFDLPSIPVVFTYHPISNNNPISGHFIERNNQIFVDFIFTFSKGNYEGQIVLDPSNPLANIHYEDGTPWEYRIKINAKKMKTVSLNFVPIDLDIDHVDVKREYLKFIKDQAKFVKEVYPLPENQIVPTIELTPLDEHSVRYNLVTMINLVKKLGKTQFLSNSKAIGVLPNSRDWWPADASGFAYTLVPFISTDKAALVKIGATGKVLAHELGHLFGLRTLVEEYSVTHSFETGSNGDKVEMLILKDGQLHNLTIPTTRDRVEPVDRERAFGNGALNVYCFMGTNSMDNEWICDDCYVNLFYALVDPVQPCLFISGLILENNTVIPDPWYTGEAEPSVLENGDFTIKCLDSSETILYTGSFGRSGNLTGFVYNIPYPIGTETVEISLGEQVIYTTSATDNPPIIENIELQELGEKQYRISWTSSDPDSDSINHLLFYSHDGGETWSNVSPEITDSEYIIDLEGLPGGEACKIRVYATDGINAVNAETGVFSLASNPPISAIFTPISNITYPEGLHTLEGLVYDMEDGVIDTPAWTSSIDGALGTGSTLVTSLSRGEHVLTLTGVDSNGNSVESVTTVKVASQVCTVTDHVLCNNVIDGSPVNVGNVFDPSSTVVSFISLANATVGDRVNWAFLGPNGLAYEDNFVLDIEGEVYAYSPLDLTQFSPELSQGQWTVTVSINGIEGSTEYFTVEEILTGLVWWAPYVGALVLVGIGAIIIGRMRKPKPVAVQVQGLCPTCSTQATWIPQYKRWYCYTCEKYLE